MDPAQRRCRTCRAAGDNARALARYADPSAAHAWHTIRGRQAGFGTAHVLGLLRGALLFAAAVAALLLFVDSRYRDFPTLLYLAPAALLGVVGWFQPAHARAERIFAVVIALSVVGRWLPEPANPQAIGWLLTGLALALPVLLVRSRQHEQ
ncbi:hypothetical protein [Thauera humireducens]|uniref:hypothetical protein n=1 Tax=Thauera humireducens TaxID=1134435 RepID=UPI00311F2F7A